MLRVIIVLAACREGVLEVPTAVQVVDGVQEPVG